MKLHHRLTLMVICTVLGLLLIAGFGLSALRSNMLENKRSEIYTVLNLAAQQVAYYQEQEQRGILSRAAAQAKAIEALSSLRDGKKTYLWARTVDALGLVHPNPEVIGKVDVGVTLADGRSKWQGYLDGLKNTRFAYFDDLAQRNPTFSFRVLTCSSLRSWARTYSALTLFHPPPRITFLSSLQSFPS